MAKKTYEEWYALYKERRARYMAKVRAQNLMPVTSMPPDDRYVTTLEDIGNALSVTKERVRQIEANALTMMRARLQRVAPELTVADWLVTVSKPSDSDWRKDYINRRSSEWRERQPIKHGPAVKRFHPQTRETTPVIVELPVAFDPTWTDIDVFGHGDSLLTSEDA